MSLMATGEAGFARAFFCTPTWSNGSRYRTTRCSTTSREESSRPRSARGVKRGEAQRAVNSEVRQPESAIARADSSLAAGELRRRILLSDRRHG